MGNGLSSDWIDARSRTDGRAVLAHACAFLARSAAVACAWFSGGAWSFVAQAYRAPGRARLSKSLVVRDPVADSVPERMFPLMTGESLTL